MQSFFSARKLEAVANEGGAILSPPPSIKYAHYLLPCMHAASLYACCLPAVSLYLGNAHPCVTHHSCHCDAFAWHNLWHAFCLVVHTSHTNCCCALACESGGCFCSSKNTNKQCECIFRDASWQISPIPNILMQQLAVKAKFHAHNNLCT